MLAFFVPVSSRATAVTLNVTNYGAKGDAVQLLAATVSNSTTILLNPSNALSSGDVGKVIELFGAGAVTTGSNHQDFAGFIIAVTNGTNVTISAQAGLTRTSVPCTIGTQNAAAFQHCIDACQGTNTVVLIPAGSYLLVPPLFLDPGFVMSSAATLAFTINIQKGGIHLLGDQDGSTRLLGNGAWALKGAYVQRGIMFGCIGPVTNDAPLLFENLTMDGGVQVGNQHCNGANPASVTDGSEWDITHDAVVDSGRPPLHAYKAFVNCRFVHWRGEMVKSVVGGPDGLIQVTNCAFIDGNASGFNFTFTHNINNCLFSNLLMAMEFYEGYMTGASTFENSTVTNAVNAIVIVGALTNHVEPPYMIRSNTLSSSKYGILFSPVRNLTVIGNQFCNTPIGIGSDSYAYQGTDCNSNILVDGSDGADLVENMTWLTNTALGCGRFATGYGWSTNVAFLGNTSLAQNNQQGGLFGAQLTGQYFIDDPSNAFPTNFCGIDSGSPGFTNTVSYTVGMRQALYQNQVTNGVFLLDTSHPAQIPEAATMVMPYIGRDPAILYLANQAPLGNPLVLNSSNVLTVQWSMGQWKFVKSSVLNAPTGLHVSEP
jgi:hypothetical protein